MIYKEASVLVKKIESGDISPVYLLHGEEGYYIDQMTNYFEEKILSESERAFNLEILYGRTVDSATLVDYARQFPMMSQYRVIIVKEAQDLKIDEKFEAYLTNPTPSTIVVLAHKNKKADGRTNCVKAIKDKYVILDAARIKEWELGNWIGDYLDQKGYTIESKATALIAEYVGSNLSRLTNELDKLIVNLEPKARIGMKEVEENIGISKDYNVFELQDALANKNYTKSHRIVANFQANINREPMEIILGSLFSFYQRLYVVKQNLTRSDNHIAKVAGINPYFVSKSKQQASNVSEKGYYHIFKLLKDYDGRTKGYNNRSTSREELLKELVGKLLLVR